MGFTLRVVFEGVLAYVPDNPFFRWNGSTWEPGNPKPSKVWVLVPNLLSCDLADWDRRTPPPPYVAEPHYRWPHVSLLSIPRRFIKDKRARELHKRLANMPDHPSRLHRVLLADLLRFTEGDRELSGGLECALKVPVKAEDKITPGTDLEERRSLWWLPQLQQIAPEYAGVDPKNNPENAAFRFSTSRLVSALCLKKGRLFVDNWNRDGDDNPRVWPFTGAQRQGKDVVECGEQRWKRAVANKLVWEVEIESRCVKLHVGNPEAERPSPVVLRKPLLSSETVTLSLTCQEAEMALTGPEMTRRMEKEIARHLSRFDPDFQCVYDLASPPMIEADKRYPYNQNGNIGLDGKPCTGGGAGGFA